MTSYTVIELDTHGPVVTWGEPDIAEAGYELAVPYTAEGEFTAELRLSDGRVLEMEVQEDYLVVLLPDDVPDWTHHVAAIDDVGNATLHALHIVGVVSSYVIIELDTQAPVVTWGEPDIAEMGLELSIPYISDTVLTGAELRLSDGRILEMDVLADRLVVMVPEDAPDGLHTIAAIGNLGNAALHQVYISGVIPVVPAGIPVGGMPGQEPPPTVGSWRSRGHFTSRTTISARRTSRMTVRPTSRTVRRREMLSHRSTLLIASHWSTAATARTGRAALMSQGATAIERTRPEGPDSDDGMVIFGLL